MAFLNVSSLERHRSHRAGHRLNAGEVVAIACGRWRCAAL
jgi:hypothetical protein